MHTQLRPWKMVDLSGHFLHFCPPVFTLFIATSLAAIALVAAGTSTLNSIFKTFRSLHTYLILVLPTKTSQKSFSSNPTELRGKPRLGCHRETLGFRSKPQRRYVIWYPKVDGMVGRQYERMGEAFGEEASITGCSQ